MILLSSEEVLIFGEMCPALEYALGLKGKEQNMTMTFNVKVLVQINQNKTYSNYSHQFILT